MPWHLTGWVARFVTGMQVGAAAVLSVLVIGRDLPMHVDQGALEVIVRRFVSDVDAATRWVARIVGE